MAEIDNGALSFKSVMDNGQMNAAIEETLRRVQGLSDGTVAGGKKIDAAFDAMAADIEESFRFIDTMYDIHKGALKNLESEYQKLGEEAAKAFEQGKDKKFNSLLEKQKEIGGEIALRKKLIKEVEAQADALKKEEQALQKKREQAEKVANTEESMRTRIKKLREEMMLMIDQGIDEQSEAYKRLADELGRLQDIQGDVAQQGRMLANDEQQFQGIITGLSGLAGGFSAVTGAISLLAGKNDDLQEVMTKIQSVMAITIGMQQVAQTLNKDSAFQLVTIKGIRDWWSEVVEKANIYQSTIETISETTESISDAISGTAETISDAIDTLSETADMVAEAANTVVQNANTASENANTVATTANTAAQSTNTAALGTNTTATVGNTVATKTQTTAATTGTVANTGLAGAFRLVGAAIKSLPVFGWIIAGITALVSLYSHFSNKAKEVAKAQEELNRKIIELAAKPVGSIIQLKNQYESLGNSMKEKEKFIRDNAKVFEELGLVVRNVADAERLLSDPANVRKFIQAQIDKARSLALVESDSYKKALSEYTEIYSKIESAKESKEAIRKTGSPHALTLMQNKDIEIEELEKELAPYQKTLEKAYTDSFNAAKAFSGKIEQLNKESNDKLKGTIAGQRLALEDEIKKLEADREKLSTEDKKGLEQVNKQLENVRKKLASLEGGKSSGLTHKDLFSEMLNEKKKQYSDYLKWLNSGDETLAKAANTEFEGLLKQGATYIEYLKRQREIIESVDVSSRTKAQNAQLRTLNDQIAEETKKTVLEAFNTELSEQLNNAKSIMQMLDIIEQKRKELANDGTDLDNSKKETLDDEEKNAIEKQKQEMKQAMADYQEYLDSKISADLRYVDERKKLEKQLADATDPKIKQVVQTQIDTLNTKKKTSDAIDYDNLVKEYANFEQKKQSIIDEYDAKRKTAQEHNNEEMIAKLNEAQAKAISALASDELMGTEVWAKLFGNLDELTAQQITTLVNEIESKFDSLSGVFNPVDLTSIRNKLNEAKGVLIQGNPFKQLGASLQAIFNDAGEDSKDSAQKIKKNWKQLAESTEKSFDFVANAINSADFLKDAIGEVGATAISSMATVASVAIAVAAAIKTAEKASIVLAIIQAALAVIQAVANVIGSIAGNKDKGIEESIQRHAAAVRDLENAYNQLAWAIDKALGNAVYKNQRVAVENMRQQQMRLEMMWKAEESKKKADANKIADYKEKYAQLGRQIQDMLDDISNDILQTDAKSFADELGDALVQAFGKGEDAATAFGAAVDNVMKNIVLNQLKKNLLEKQLEPVLKELENQMGYWTYSDDQKAKIESLKREIAEAKKQHWSTIVGRDIQGLEEQLKLYLEQGNEYIFTGLTDAQIEAFKAQVSNISTNFNDALEQYSDIFKDAFGTDMDTSLTGAVKGVTEETASLVAGQMNAMRINQMEATAILRQQLMYLATIAQNTSYNRFLQDIDSKLDIITNSGDPLRSQGLS
jgi:hypothetical protein